MATAKVKVEGQDRVRKTLRRLNKLSEGAIEDAIAAGALDVETEAKRLVQRGPKTGVVYNLSNPNRVHRSSAPGESPATDTGHLVRNIGHRLDADRLGADVHSRASYSEELEFGTQNMEARPFMQPAFERHKKRITKAISDAIKGAGKKEARRKKRR